LLVLSLLLDGPSTVATALTEFSWRNGISTAYTAVLSSLLGYTIWNSLLARHPTSAVVPFVLLVPPVGIASAWWALGQAPNVAELAGGAVLLLGVAVTMLRRVRTSANTATATDDVPADRIPVTQAVGGGT
jgi:O-acetylserine/cysteine efflux transporter